MEEKTKKEIKKVEEPQNITLENATIEQIKAAAFDTEQQIKGLQRHYQILINALESRLKGEQDGNN